jgi:hypothetical protein
MEITDILFEDSMTTFQGFFTRSDLKVEWIRLCFPNILQDPVHFNLICTDVQRSFGLIIVATIESLRDWQLIQADAWQNTARTDGHWSGKLTNPGKHFFLQLIVDSVEDVNQEIDCHNISYSRKTMIRCGMALVLDGIWSVAQLFHHLQEIVAKHDQYFQGPRCTRQY